MAIGAATMAFGAAAYGVDQEYKIDAHKIALIIAVGQALSGIASLVACVALGIVGTPLIIMSCVTIFTVTCSLKEAYDQYNIKYRH